MNKNGYGASPESRTPARAALSPADQKRITTLAARAALVGVTLTRIEGDFVRDVYIVSRWSLTREFTNLDALEAWIDLVSGTPSRA